MSKCDKMFIKDRREIMSGEMIIILGIAAYILTIIAIIVALNFLSRKKIVIIIKSLI